MGCKEFTWMNNVSKDPVNNFEWIQDTSQFNEDFHCVKSVQIES